MKKFIVVFMLSLLIMASVQTATAVGPSTRVMTEINGIPASCANGCVGMSACASWALFCMFIAAHGPGFDAVGPYESW